MRARNRRTSGLGQDLGILRDRRFTLMLAARMFSALGLAFAPVALAFGVLELPGATAATLSLVLAAESTPMVLFMLVGGVIADRMPRDRVMMAGETFNAIGYFSLGAMLLTGWAPVPALAAAAAFSGIASAIVVPAMTGIVPDVVPAARLQTANALLGLVTNVSRIAGLVLSGAAVALLSGGWALVASGAMFAAAAVLIALLRLTPAERAENGSGSIIADLRLGWREFASRQWLWVVVAQFSIVVMAVNAAHGVLGPLIAKEHLGGAPAWSAFLTGEAVGMLTGVLIAMRIRPQRPVLITALLAIPSALPYLLLGGGAPLWAVVAGAFVLGVSFDVLGVLWNTTMQREIPPEALSRVSSYDALGSLMFGPIGLLVAGPAALMIGPRPALIGCAVIIVAVSLVAVLFPGVRGLRAPAPAPAAAADGSVTAPAQ